MRLLQHKCQTQLLLSTLPEEKTALLEKFGDLQLKYAAHHLPKLTSAITRTDDYDILLPYLLELFATPETSVQAVYYLTSTVAQTLGPHQSKKYLLPLITQLYESDQLTEKHLKLFHRSFLLHLIVWFGLQTFLNSFMIALVEGVGGYKELHCNGRDTPDGLVRKQSTTLRYLLYKYLSYLLY